MDEHEELTRTWEMIRRLPALRAQGQAIRDLDLARHEAVSCCCSPKERTPEQNLLAQIRLARLRHPALRRWVLSHADDAAWLCGARRDVSIGEMAREVLGAARLSREEEALLTLTDERWSANQPAPRPLAVRLAEWRQRRLSLEQQAKDRAFGQVRAAFSAAYYACQFRQASASRWVDRKTGHVLRVSRHQYPQAAMACESEKVWHTCKTRSATLSTHRFWLRDSWQRDVERRGLARIGDMLTIDAKRITGLRRVERAYQLVMVRQGRGTALVIEHAVALRHGDGWVTGASLNEARRHATRAARQQETQRAATAAE